MVLQLFTTKQCLELRVHAALCVHILAAWCTIFSNLSIESIEQDMHNYIKGLVASFSGAVHPVNTSFQALLVNTA